jgi:hypothetical protein
VKERKKLWSADTTFNPSAFFFNSCGVGSRLVLRLQMDIMYRLQVVGGGMNGEKPATLLHCPDRMRTAPPGFVVRGL